MATPEAMATHVSLFMTSPAKPSLSPESLSAVLPKDVNATFWTAERRFLSPKSAKDVCWQHPDRHIMALVSKKSPLPDGSSSQKKMHMITSLMEKVLQKQQTLQVQVERMQKHMEDKEQEQEFYSSLCLTRSLAVVSLMATLLKMLNNFFMQRASQNWKDVRAMKLVFPKETEISYFRAWWFLYHETLEVRGLSLQQFWAQNNQLSYSGKRQPAGPRKKGGKVGTPQANLFVRKLSRIMGSAEHDCIRAVGQSGMNADMLRKVIGFYISVLRVDRNAGTHLLENLLVVDVLEGEHQPKYQRPEAKEPFKLINRDLVLSRDKETQKKGAMVIEDILLNIDKLGSLSCISPAVKWFGEWLLSMIPHDKEDENEDGVAEHNVEESKLTWEWCGDLNCELQRHENGLCYDRQGRQWAFFDERWLLWIPDLGGWCRFDGGQWRFHC